MGTVHRLITAEGKQAALQEGTFERAEVEAAASYLSDEDPAIGFLYSGFCQAALPHKRLPDAEGWHVQSGRVSLIVEPGMRLGRTGALEPVGVPYGSRARLILIYLQSEAIRTQSRDITLGRSLRGWLGRLGISVGGASISAVRDQAERISRCHLTFQIARGRALGLINQNIMETALFLDSPPEGQGSLFLETATLSDGFYRQLQQHSVPLEEAAVRAVANNSMALDIYAWLAYRLHSLTGPTQLHWKAVKTQFGVGFAQMNGFKPRFLDNLRLALAVYPDARVDVDERGLVLHPSRPPVSPRQIAAGC
jgi:hypothetical protein